MLAWLAAALMTPPTILAAPPPLPAPQGVDRGSSFILSCDCATAGQRARVRRAIVRAGGRIIYSYDAFEGFAVAARRPRDAAWLERRLRTIPGVYAVRPDGMIRLPPPGEPQ